MIIKALNRRVEFDTLHDSTFPAGGLTAPFAVALKTIYIIEIMVTKK